MSFTLRNALISTTTGYETIDLQIVEDRITAMGSDLEPLGTVIDASCGLLLPGFINAHTHSPEMWLRGLIRPFPLELWLAELYELVPLTTQRLYWSALGTAVETLLSGGTSVVDHLVLLPGQELESVAAAAKAYQETGIRAFIAPLIQDLPLPAGIPNGGIDRPLGSYVRTLPETLALMVEIIRQFHRPEEGVSIVLGPTGMQLCSDDLFSGCVELSQTYDLARHTHLLETQAQVKLAQEKYGRSAVAHLQDLGFLNSRTSLAHCVWLTPSDTEILAAMGSTVVHNPLSNLRLGSGIAPVLKYGQAGVNVSFGCDGSASNDAQDLLEAVKIGSLLHNITDPDYRHWLTAHQSLTMASYGGAKGLGLQEEMGSLRVGQKADLVLYDLTNLSLLPQTDPLQLLLWGRPVQAVQHSWVNGVAVITEGTVQGCDVTELRQELWEQSQGVRMATPSHTMLHQLEDHYRQVMHLTP